MGNTITSGSRRDDSGLPSLDELGGYWRPAVKREHELETKMQWMGEEMLEQADFMEASLDKDRADKDTVMKHMSGAPLKWRPGRRGMGFMSSTGPVAPPPRPPSLSEAAPATAASDTIAALRATAAVPVSGRLTGDRASSPLPDHASGASQRPTPSISVGLPSTGSSPLKMTPHKGVGVGLSISPTGGAAGSQPQPSQAWADSPKGAGAGRDKAERAFGGAEARESAAVAAAATAAAGKGRSPLTLGASGGAEGRDPGVPTSPGKGRTSMVTTTRGGKGKQAQQQRGGAGALASAKSGGVGEEEATGSSAVALRRPLAVERWAPGAEYIEAQKEEELGMHWRDRVVRARRRLYWYLRGYLAWMSILRRLRRGYAESLAVEVLPMLLANALGELAPMFGAQLAACKATVDGNDKKTRIKLLVLRVARHWRDWARRKCAARGLKLALGPTGLQAPDLDALEQAALLGQPRNRRVSAQMLLAAAAAGSPSGSKLEQRRSVPLLSGACDAPSAAGLRPGSPSSSGGLGAGPRSTSPCPPPCAGPVWGGRTHRPSLPSEVFPPMLAVAPSFATAAAASLTPGGAPSPAAPLPSSFSWTSAIRPGFAFSSTPPASPSEGASCSAGSQPTPLFARHSTSVVPTSPSATAAAHSGNRFSLAAPPPLSSRASSSPQSPSPPRDAQPDSPKRATAEAPDPGPLPPKPASGPGDVSSSPPTLLLPPSPSSPTAASGARTPSAPSPLGPARLGSRPVTPLAAGSSSSGACAPVEGSSRSFTSASPRPTLMTSDSALRPRTGGNGSGSGAGLSRSLDLSIGATRPGVGTPRRGNAAAPSALKRKDANQTSKARVVQQMRSVWMDSRLEELDHKGNNKQDLQQMVKAEEINMQVLANRANAAWINTFTFAHPTRAPGHAGLAPRPPAAPHSEDASSSAPSSPSAAGHAASLQPHHRPPHHSLHPHIPGSGGAKWCPPWTVELLERNLKEVYRRLGPGLLTEGRVAMQLVYLGEEQVVGTAAQAAQAKPRARTRSRSGSAAGDAGTAATAGGAQENDGSRQQRDGEQEDDNTLPAIQADFWAAIQALFPLKIPEGQRLCGLTLLDRRVLQTIVEVEKAAGKAGVTAMYLLLAVDALHAGWVVEQAASRKHWGLQPEQIIIVSIARFPGMVWDTASRMFRLNYDTRFPYMCAGSGYAMLSLAWPSSCFWVTSEGKRTYLYCSVLQLLREKKVTYIYSSLMVDYAQLSSNCPFPDTSFMGTALYGMESQGAGMVMEALQGRSDALMRQQGNVVMAPGPNTPFSCSVSHADLMVAASRAMVNNALKSNKGIWSATSRYLYQVSHLAEVCKGPNSFHLDVEVQAPCAYLTMHMADLTSHPLSRCIAVPARVQGPDAHASLLGRDHLRHLAATLQLQDAQTAFRSRACCLVPGCTVVTLSDVMAGAGGRSNGAVRILLLVKDNGVSRLAFRLCCSLVRHPSDVILLLHVVTARLDEVTSPAVLRLLDSFSHPAVDHLIQRQVVQQDGNLQATMQAQVAALNPGLVVMGTECIVKEQTAGLLQLAQGVKSASGSQASTSSPLGSSSLTAAMTKAALPVPLLIVKGSSSWTPGGAEGGSRALMPLKAAVEVSSSTLPMMSWLLSRLSPDRDRLVLVKPRGLDPDTNAETQQTSRLLAAFTNEASGKGFMCSKRSFAEGHLKAFRTIAQQERVDLVVLAAPASKVTPDHVLDLIRVARSNVLVWRPDRDASASRGAG